MKMSVIIGGLLITSQLLFAEVVTVDVEAEHIYRRGEKFSPEIKKMVRSMALQDAIEQAGVRISSIFYKKLSSDGQSYSKVELESYSSAVVKNKIIKQKHLPDRYALKLRATINTDGIEKMMAHNQSIRKEFSEIREKQAAILKELREVKKEKPKEVAIVEKSWSHTTYPSNSQRQKALDEKWKKRVKKVEKDQAEEKARDERLKKLDEDWKKWAYDERKELMERNIFVKLFSISTWGHGLCDLKGQIFHECNNKGYK